MFSLRAQAECGVPQGPAVRVERVLDGDTVKLADGRSVRVIGINAPEIAHRQQPSQALGPEAKAAAQAFVRAANYQVRLALGDQPQDRYGRTLAHVYDKKGQSLAASLARQGLAFAIAIPPNNHQAQCLFQLQQRARRHNLGVWGSPAWRARQSLSLARADTGFMRIRGRVERVTVNSAAWLELEGKLVVRVAKSDWRTFGASGGFKVKDWQAMRGRELELQGWVVKRGGKGSRRKPLLMSLRSPLAMGVTAP